MNLRIAPLIALALGCGTSLSGTRDTRAAPPNPKQQPQELQGVPIQLTRPTFALVEKPPADGKPLTYALTLAYRPDPSERYLVNIQPAYLATTELSVSFGAAGQLTALNGSSTSAVTTTITALGEFVTGAIGVAAKGAGTLAAADKGVPAAFKDLPSLLQDVQPGEQAPFCRLATESARASPKPAGPAVAPVPEPIAAAAGPELVPAAAVQSAPAGVAPNENLPRDLPVSSDERVRDVGGGRCPRPVPGEGKTGCEKRLRCVRANILASLEPSLGEDAQLAALHPYSREEAALFVAAAERAKVADAALGPAMKKYMDIFVAKAIGGGARAGSGEVPSYDSAPAPSQPSTPASADGRNVAPPPKTEPSPPEKERVVAQKRAPEGERAEREETARGAVAELDAAVAAAGLDRLSEVQCPRDFCVDPTGEATSAWRSAKELAELRIREARLRAGFQSASRLAPDEWRARHAQYLERRIAWRLGQAGLRGDTGLADVHELRRKLAITIDASPEYERAALLERRLAEPIAPKTDAAAFAGREAARKELESVQAVIAQKRQALRPAARADASPQQREIRLEPVWKPDASAATPGWARYEATKRGSPEFLLVVEQGTQP